MAPEGSARIGKQQRSPAYRYKRSRVFIVTPLGPAVDGQAGRMTGGPADGDGTEGGGEAGQTGQPPALDCATPVVSTASGLALAATATAVAVAVAVVATAVAVAVAVATGRRGGRASASALQLPLAGRMGGWIEAWTDWRAARDLTPSLFRVTCLAMCWRDRLLFGVRKFYQLPAP